MACGEEDGVDQAIPLVKVEVQNVLRAGPAKLTLVEAVEEVNRPGIPGGSVS